MLQSISEWGISSAAARRNCSDAVRTAAREALRALRAKEIWGEKGFRSALKPTCLARDSTSVCTACNASVSPLIPNQSTRRLLHELKQPNPDSDSVNGRCAAAISANPACICFR